MDFIRTISGIVAGLLLFVAPHVAARPGDLDPSFGTAGIARPPAFEGDENVLDAIGTSTRWITGRVGRGQAAHLFIAKLAADGTPDPTFGTAGKSMLRWDHGSYGAAIRQQADGKLVVAGGVLVGPFTHLLVARFNANGTLDTSFGTNGTFTMSPPGYSFANALAIAPDGKIVVLGDTRNTTSDMMVLRLTPAGALDPTFGTGGVQVVDFRGGFDFSSSMELLPSGKILIAGTGSQSSGLDFAFAAARLNADGSVDASFGPAGQNGLALYVVGGAYDFVGAMALSGSAIVIGGTSTRVGHTGYELSALRLTADGARDPSFGVDGAAFAPTPTGTYFLDRMAVQPDGKVVLASSGVPTIARFTASGALDPAFGTAGLVTDGDPYIYKAGTIIVNADGTLSFFGGRATLGQGYRIDVGVMRYTASGVRDTTFGSGGAVGSNLFTLSWDSRAVGIGTTGRVFIAGTLYDVHDAEAAITRLTAQGQYDGAGFGPPDAVPLGASDDIANALVVLPDDSIVVAGRKNLQGTSSFLLAKFDGRTQLPDTSFGDFGTTTHTMGIGFAEALALARQPDGKFVSAGSALMGSGNNDFALARYSANGILDATFGTGGVVITPFGPLNDVAQAVAIQPDGKIVAAGYTLAGSFFDIAIARYNADGSLDATFGSGGKLVIAASASNDQGSAVAITREGKILVAGYVFNGSNQNIGVVRVNANGTLDTSFATNGVASVDVAGGADRAWGMTLQRNGKIVLAGQGFDGTANAFVAVRLQDNGARDASFGTNGVKVIDASPTSDFGRAVALQPDGRIVIAGTSGTNLAVVRLLGDLKKVTQADADNDGREDLYWRDAAGGLSWWLMNGAVATSTNFQSVGTEWQLVDTGDFNGDGKADLVWRNLNDGSVYLWFLDGLNVTSTVSPGAPSLDYVLVGAADLNGDGKSDLVFRSASTGQVYVWLMNGGSIIAQGAIGNPGTEWRVVDLADFDGDGKADILWQRTTDGLVYTWWMDGLTIRFSFGIAQLDPALWTLVSSGDFNGDGIADLLWRSTAGDTWVWLLDGMGGVTAGGIGNPGGAWSIKSVADLDGDGRDDLVWRHTDGTTYFWKMNGISVTSTTPITNPGGTWQIAAP